MSGQYGLLKVRYNAKYDNWDVHEEWLDEENDCMWKTYPEFQTREDAREFAKKRAPIATELGHMRTEKLKRECVEAEARAAAEREMIEQIKAKSPKPRARKTTKI